MGDSAPSVPVTLIAHDIGPRGGMERQLFELIAGLAASGHEVTVVARTLQPPPGAPVRFIRVPGPRRPFPIAYPWFMVAGSVAAVRHRRGVLHATGAIVLIRADVVAVHLCHHAIARLGTVPRSAGNSSARRLNARIAAALSRAGERWTLRPRRVRSVVAVSRGVAEEVTANFRDLAGLVTTIPNGVDTQRFSPGPPSDEARRAVRIAGVTHLALFVGSEWAGKGLRHAIKALTHAPGWGLAVVGRGDEDSMRALASREGVDDRIRFTGERGDLGDIYRAVDAFVLPSAYETFSLVAHEAAASALPLVVTPVHGIVDLVEDGVSGWLVDADAAAIGARLREIGRDRSAASRLGFRARAATVELSWPTMVDAYQGLYAKLATR